MKGGSVYPIACWDTHPLGPIPPARHPKGRHPMGRHPMGRHPQTPPYGRHTSLADTPLGKHPRGQTSPGQKPPRQTHTRLGSHPFPPDMATAADGTHPTPWDSARLPSSCTFYQFSVYSAEFTSIIKIYQTNPWKWFHLQFMTEDFLF